MCVRACIRIHAYFRSKPAVRGSSTQDRDTDQGPKAWGRHVMWDFPKIRVPYFGVLLIWILLFRVLYSDPLFSETPPCRGMTFAKSKVEAMGPWYAP